MGIGTHQGARMMKDEWLTPPEILRALGPFDLDPCAPVKRPWDMATNHFTVEDLGLSRQWFGRVWCNPPYGKNTGLWLRRLADHGDGIALVFARTETTMFFSEVWCRSDAVLFIEGRLHFHHVDGSKAKANAGAPSVLIAYGERNALSLEESGINGVFVKNWQKI